MNQTTTYWNNNGKHQQAVEVLNKLVPDFGSVVNPAKNKALEKFRKASGVYYDIYNNGLCNRAKQFKVFNIGPLNSVADRKGMYHKFFGNGLLKVEQAMDTIVAEAYREQQSNLPADSQSLIKFD